MGIALRLARQGQGNVAPNPKVGAVIIKNNRLIGWGYHPHAGDPHAEIFALRKAGALAKDATLYITLEPCCHFGKTPPCTTAIINSGIRRVVVATYDPNPQVRRKGLKELLKAGIEVHYGLFKKEAQLLNKEFFTFYVKKRPYIRIKFAMTLDGKIATSNRESCWLSSDTSRSFTNRLRALSDALLVGITTILQDNPRLTIRTGRRKAAVFHRIILDTFLKTPPDALLFDSVDPVLLFTSADQNTILKTAYPAHCEIIQVSSSGTTLNLSEIITILYHKNIESLLVEGGAQTISSFLEAKIADEIFAVIAPALLGGTTSLNFAQFINEKPLNAMLSLQEPKIIKIHNDIILNYQLG